MTFASFASVGPLLPHDLFAASGRYAGPLGWTLDRPMPFAAEWMENRFAPWAASILEDWAAGAFDAHEAVVFARADDSAQRLYYYLCELRRRGVMTGGPEPLAQLVGIDEGPVDQFARRVEDARDGDFRTLAHTRQTSAARSRWPAGMRRRAGHAWLASLTSHSPTMADMKTGW